MSIEKDIIRRRSPKERQAYIDGWAAALNVVRNKGVHIAELSLGVMRATNNVSITNTKEAPMESEDQAQDDGDEVQDAAAGAAEGAVEGAQDDDAADGGDSDE